ncbi:MAG: hypothetical protein HYY11_03525 [Candidatus Methylomirabilis oxyfera]|nr:hypothetical protein [Candidatus Methylomirabilis oxyfera]
MIAVDGTDVTSQVARRPGRLTYRPASGLTPGPHTVTLTFPDPDSGEGEPIQWSFTIRDYSALEEGSLDLEGSLTYEQAAKRLQGTDPHWNLNGNVKITGRASERGVVATLDGNLRYIDAEGPGPPGPGQTPRNNFDLADFLLTLSKDPHKLQLGDVQVAESFLSTGFAFPRRGGLLSVELFGAELHLFQVRSDSIIGFDHGLGIGDPDRRVQGASIARDLLPDKALRMKVTYLDGENASPGAFNIGSAEGGQRGDLLSVLASSSLFGQRLRGEGEAAFSRFDVNTADEFGRRGDSGVRVKVDGTLWETLNLGAEYQRMGLNFQSIANPNFVRDREGITTSANTRWGPTQYTLGFSQAHDNVRDDPLLPRIRQRTYSAAWGLQVPDYPSLTLNYNRSEQASAREPAGFDRLDTVTDLFGAGLTYSQPTWSANLNGSYSLQDNRNGTVPPDSTTWNATTGLSYRPTPRLNLAPSFGFTRSHDRLANVTASTYLPTVTANVALIPDLLTFDTQASFTRTVADDESIRSNSFTGIFRLSLSLERFLLNYGKQTVSLRFNYNRFDDEFSSLNSRQQWGLFVIIDLLAPLPLLPPAWGGLFGPKTVGRLPDVQTAFGFKPVGH